MWHHALERNKKETNKREACGLLTHAVIVVVVVVAAVVVVVGAAVAAVVVVVVGAVVVVVGSLHCIPHLSLASWTH